MNKGPQEKEKKAKAVKKSKSSEKEKSKDKPIKAKKDKEKQPKQKKERPEGQPKKPPTAYFLFCAEKRNENKDKKWLAKELGELFKNLPEEEKVYDRNTSIETLKLITKLGFQITKCE